MLRPVWKTCLSLAAWMVACWLLSASSAQAGWGHWRHGGCGWGGCYSPAYVYTTSFCRPCVTGCGVGWYNPSWGCYSGWYSGSAWYNPSWGCYAGCYAPGYGGYSIVSGCCDSVVVDAPVDGAVAPTPAPPPPPAEPPALEPSSVLPPPPPPGDVPKPTARDRVPASATLFTVVVPEDAQVYVNGLLTKTPGAQRQYISYGLHPGHTYTYVVRAVVTRNGRTLEDAQTVHVSAGTERLVAFDLGGGRPHAAIASRVR